MSDVFYVPSPDPLWFVSSEVLTDLFRTELSFIKRSLADQPRLSDILDSPVATLSERKICFTVLAHRKVVDIICEDFVERYEQPPLSDEESDTLRRTTGLVSTDAPNWVLEIDRVVDRFLLHLCDALPGPLQVRRFVGTDTAQMEAINSLNNVERLQALIERVLVQQLERVESRLSGRYNRGLVGCNSARSKRKIRRTQDKQRSNRDRIIAEIDSVSPTVSEFLQLMDEREIPPQPTWRGWPGSWRQAYKDPRLRTLIHKDKSRAIKRAARRR